LIALERIYSLSRSTVPKTFLFNGIEFLNLEPQVSSLYATAFANGHVEHNDSVLFARHAVNHTDYGSAAMLANDFLPIHVSRYNAREMPHQAPTAARNTGN
jgi:hypothetical protein